MFNVILFLDGASVCQLILNTLFYSKGDFIHFPESKRTCEVVRVTHLLESSSTYNSTVHITLREVDG